MLVPGEKFAFICFNRTDIHHEMPALSELPNGYIACKKLPGAPDPHWREWIGTLRSEELEQADLYIGSKMVSNNPDVLDAENQLLQKRALCLYWAMHLTDFVRAYSRTFTFTGTVRDDGLNLRSVGEMDSSKFVPGTPRLSSHIDVPRLTQAAELAERIHQLYDVTGFPRFKRVFGAFTTGINANLADVRLHQFVRCIEGFILPDPGDTKRQFKSRTTHFVGPREHGFTAELSFLFS